jgi:anti-sigma B factor antagonist
MTHDAATIDFDDADSNLRIIHLRGRLDIQGTDAIGTRFAILASSEGRRIVVDLSALEFLASIGIRSLVTNAKAQQQRAGRLVLFVGDNAAVAKVLTTTGIDTVIPMFTDEAGARAAALA